MSAPVVSPGACARSTSALPPVGAVINAAPPAADRAQRATFSLRIRIRLNLFLDLGAPQGGQNAWSAALFFKQRTPYVHSSLVAYASTDEAPSLDRDITCCIWINGTVFEIPEAEADRVAAFLEAHRR